MAKVPPPTQPKSRKGEPPPLERIPGNLDKPEAGSLKPLNFKVPDDFRKEFKTYAVQQGISMVELLQQAFALIKSQRG
jgi:hypothetical protein